MKKFRVKSRKESFEKKLLFGLLVLGVFLFMGSTAVAGTIKYIGVGDMGGGGPYNSSWEGELRFDPAGSGIPYFTSVFDTFCLERSEYIYANKNYNWTIDTGAIGGGLGGGNPDPLDPKTAWLFVQYLNNFGGYDAATYAMSDPNAELLQEAIWYIEQEITDDLSGNKYYQLALANAGTDIGNVRVLNLTKYDDGQSGTLRQSVLTVVPIPGAVWLLGSGLLGLAGIRMRSRRNSV